jgi:hypothetical protein
LSFGIRWEGEEREDREERRMEKGKGKEEEEIRGNVLREWQ